MQFASVKNFTSVEKLLIYGCFLSIIAYIYFYFQGTREQLILIKLSLPDVYNTTGLMKSIFALSITLCSIGLYFSNKKNLTFTGRILFVFSIYMFLVTLFNPDNDNIKRYVNQFTSMSLWIYIYLFFYSFSLKYYNPAVLKKGIIIFYFLFYILFIVNYTSGLALNISWHYIESYFCVMMLPFIFLTKGKWKTILVVLTIIIALLSAKRSGTIACISTLIIYYFFKDKGFSKKIRMFFLIVFSAAIIFLIINHFFNEELTNMIDRFENISEDGGSGRDVVYEEVLDMIMESPTGDLIFGHGYNKVIEDSTFGFSAHNDFLEVTYDYGMFGLLLYLLFYISILKKISLCKSRNLKATLFASFMLLFIFSMTSHLILFPTSILCLCAFWGFLDGCIKNNSPIILTGKL